MIRTQVALVTLALTILSVSSQANICAATSTLTSLGFSENAANVVNNGTCKNYYSTNGACVPSGQLINTLNIQNKWLQAHAINANNYALQFVNATIYWQTNNGFINANTPVPATNTSFWQSVGNFFTSLYNRATSLFQTTVAWVQNLFNKSTSAVNPCFQAWANLTNGAYCVATSSNNVTASLVANVGLANTFTLTVDPTSTGNQLQACLPLIDNYCSIQYGISTTNLANPFNTTFNIVDGGLSASDCYNIRNQTNCTTAACTANLNNFLTGFFFTNWVKFVPAANQIASLGTFFNTTANVTTYTPTAQSASGAGINFVSASNAFGENVYADGLVSGQPALIYGSSFSLISTLMFALLALLI